MTNLANVKICVVVPTRNRPSTLSLLLKSLLHQSYDNFCVVISDNSDEEQAIENKAILDEYRSEIDILLIAPGVPMSMSEHWNFIIDRAVEDIPDADYYSFLTDRCIYHPEGLSVLSKAVGDAGYPDLIMYQVAHLRQVDGDLTFKALEYKASALTQIKCGKLLQSFASGQRNLPSPRFLNSMMKRNALIDLREKNNNTVFGGIAPDYYYAFLVLAHCDTYSSLALPITAAIAEDLSNGGNFTGFQPNAASRDFEQKTKNEQSDYLKIGPIPNEIYLLHNAILREYILRYQIEEANEDVCAKFPKIDPMKFYRNSLRQLMEGRRNGDPAIIASSLENLETYAAQYPELKTFMARTSTKIWQALLWVRIFRNRAKWYLRGGNSTDSRVEHYNEKVMKAIEMAS